MSQQGLKSKAVSGAIWSVTERVFYQGVHFVIGVILARILSPSDYGIVGMLAIFIAIANIFTNCGMGSALIQKKDATNTDFSTAFYFNLAVALFSYFILFVSAPFIAEFYKIPILKDVTRVIALSIVISGFTVVQNSRLSKNLDFKKKSIISIISIVISGFTGIILAVNGFGVWSLVFQTLSDAFTRASMIWFISRWTPGLCFSVESFKHLFGFGSRILGANLVNTIYQNLYTLVIGRVFSPSAVGYYNRANGYAMLPTQAIQEMSLAVNYPILAKIQDDNNRLLAAYQKILSIPLYILYPILIGLATIADPLIEIMVGAKWLPCVPFLQVLCFGYMFQPLTHTNLNLLYVKGRTDLVLRLEFIKKPIGFLILFLTLPFGIFAMVIGKAFYEIFAFFCNCYYTSKILNYGVIPQIRVVVPIVLKSLFMGLIVYFSIALVESSLIKVLISIPIGILSYIILSIITNDACYNEIRGIILSKLRNQ